MVLHQPANAQPAANPSQSSAAPRGASLPDMDSLEEFLLTVTKREESLQKILISVTAISGQALDSDHKAHNHRRNEGHPVQHRSGAEAASGMTTEYMASQ
jgi:hypothetical protein